MLFIEDRNGLLLNLEHAHEIDIEERHRECNSYGVEYVVVVRCLGYNAKPREMHDPVLDIEIARGYLKKLKTKLKERKFFMVW